MTEIKIKSELPPIRCDICHQMDMFNKETNICTRCKDIKKETVLNEAPNYQPDVIKDILQFILTNKTYNNKLSWNTFYVSILLSGIVVLYEINIIYSKIQFRVITVFIKLLYFPVNSFNFVYSITYKPDKSLLLFECITFWIILGILLQIINNFLNLRIIIIWFVAFVTIIVLSIGLRSHIIVN